MGPNRLTRRSLIVGYWSRLGVASWQLLAAAKKRELRSLAGRAMFAPGNYESVCVCVWKRAASERLLGDSAPICPSGAAHVTAQAPGAGRSGGRSRNGRSALGEAAGTTCAECAGSRGPALAHGEPRLGVLGTEAAPVASAFVFSGPSIERRLRREPLGAHARHRSEGLGSGRLRS